MHPPRLSRLALAALLAAPLLPAQPDLEPGFAVWILDTGASQANPAPVLRVTNPAGVTIATVMVPGSGAARGLGFDADGFAYVCRGNVVHKLDPAGTPTPVMLNAPSGGGPPQDVVALNDGSLLVGWGATASASRIGRYDRTTGALLQTITSSMLDHPRRLAVVDDATVIVASRGNDRLLRIDLAATPPAVTQLIDLTMMNVGPVGLAYDPTRGAVWVVGDYGQANLIGLVPLSSPGFTTVLNYSTAGPAGFFAPSACLFDRFRRLYVGGRNAMTMAGTGVGGAYVFNATSGATLTSIATFPVSGTPPASVIDVAIQPVFMDTCAPMDPVSGDFVLVDGPVGTPETNVIVFDAPNAPGAVYAAALSAQWPVSVDPFVPGVLDPTLTIGGTDPRGVPLLNDLLFRGSAAVPVPGACVLCGPGDVPLPSLGIFITGFVGTLDASGFATGTVALGQGLPPSTSVALSLAWVTVDPAVPSGFGLISNPRALTLRGGPLAVTPCALGP